MNQEPLSQLAETLIGSEIVKLGNMINERIQKGEKIYNFTIGDFDPKLFPIPIELEEAIVAAYRNKKTNYPAAEGVLSLRESVSKFLLQFEGLNYQPNEIQIASGGRPLIYAIFRAIVDKGDKVIYGVPSWNNNHYVHMTEGEHCLIPCLPENHFMPAPADIAAHIKGATLLCLCTPQNPTGTTLSKDSLAAICNLVIQENESRAPTEKKLYLLFDQMYWTLTYGATQHHHPIHLQPAMKDYCIFVDGISKVFAATGVRIGWSMGPAFLMAKIKAILSHIGAWGPMAEQQAVAHYLNQTEAIQRYLTDFKKALEDRLQKIYQGFLTLKAKGYSVDAIYPQAAIYLTIQIDLVGKTCSDGTKLTNQESVTAYLLGEAKIALVPFSAFGASSQSNWYRLSVGTCVIEEIPQMLGQLEAALSKLK